MAEEPDIKPSAIKPRRRRRLVEGWRSRADRPFERHQPLAERGRSRDACESISLAGPPPDVGAVSLIIVAAHLVRRVQRGVRSSRILPNIESRRGPRPFTLPRLPFFSGGELTLPPSASMAAERARRRRRLCVSSSDARRSKIKTRAQRRKVDLLIADCQGGQEAAGKRARSACHGRCRLVGGRCPVGHGDLETRWSSLGWCSRRRARWRSRDATFPTTDNVRQCTSRPLTPLGLNRDRAPPRLLSFARWS